MNTQYGSKLKNDKKIFTFKKILFGRLAVKKIKGINANTLMK